MYVVVIASDNAARLPNVPSPMVIAFKLIDMVILFARMAWVKEGIYITISESEGRYQIAQQILTNIPEYDSTMMYVFLDLRLGKIS